MIKSHIKLIKIKFQSNIMNYITFFGQKFVYTNFYNGVKPQKRDVVTSPISSTNY